MVLEGYTAPGHTAFTKKTWRQETWPAKAGKRVGDLLTIGGQFSL